MARKSSPLGCLGLGVFVLWAAGRGCGGSGPVNSPTPTPYNRPATAEEIAWQKKQDAAMEAKARREEAEVRAIEKQRAEDQAADDRLNYIRQQQYAAQQPVQTPQYQEPAYSPSRSGQAHLSPGNYETHIGPKGGKFHYSASGNKVYEKR